jgi:hypothetical protein
LQKKIRLLITIIGSQDYDPKNKALMKSNITYKYHERALKRLAWKNDIQLSHSQMLVMLKELKQYQSLSPQAFAKKLAQVYHAVVQS